MLMAVVATPVTSCEKDPQAAEKKAHTTYSINPENIIAERLEKKGYRKMPELKQENLDKSIIIKYKETARRNKAKVNVEFISADTHKILCKGRAKGHGTKDEAKKATPSHWRLSENPVCNTGKHIYSCSLETDSNERAAVVFKDDLLS